MRRLAVFALLFVYSAALGAERVLLQAGELGEESVSVVVAGGGITVSSVAFDESSRPGHSSCGESIRRNRR